DDGPGSTVRADTEHGCYLAGGLVSLKCIAPAKRAADAKDREDHREHLTQGPELDRLKASREIVHRPAVNGAVLVDIAILDAQRTLNELRGHAQKARDDHP